MLRNHGVLEVQEANKDALFKCQFLNISIRTNKYKRGMSDPFIAHKKTFQLYSSCSQEENEFWQPGAEIFQLNAKWRFSLSIDLQSVSR